MSKAFWRLNKSIYIFHFSTVKNYVSLLRQVCICGMIASKTWQEMYNNVHLFEENPAFDHELIFLFFSLL